MKELYKTEDSAVHFNECNNVAFHDVSRNKVAIATHNLTSLLGLGPTICPHVDRFSFRKFGNNYT